MKAKLYFNGIPTDVDIKKLEAEWPAHKMKIGDQFLYSKIEDVIGVSKATNRFRTVVDQWRKKVEADTNKIISPMRDASGLCVLSESGKYELMQKRMREAVGKSKRAVIIAVRTDRKQLTHEEQAGFDHMQRASAAMIAAAQLKRKPQLPE